MRSQKPMHRQAGPSRSKHEIRSQSVLGAFGIADGPCMEGLYAEAFGRRVGDCPKDPRFGLSPMLVDRLDRSAIWKASLHVFEYRKRRCRLFQVISWLSRRSLSGDGPEGHGQPPCTAGVRRFVWGAPLHAACQQVGWCHGRRVAR